MFNNPTVGTMYDSEYNYATYCFRAQFDEDTRSYTLTVDGIDLRNLLASKCVISADIKFGFDSMVGMLKLTWPDVPWVLDAHALVRSMFESAKYNLVVTGKFGDHETLARFHSASTMIEMEVTPVCPRVTGAMKMEFLRMLQVLEREVREDYSVKVSEAQLAATFKEARDTVCDWRIGQYPV